MREVGQRGGKKKGELSPDEERSKGDMTGMRSEDRVMQLIIVH